MTIGVFLAFSPIFNRNPKFYDNSSVKTDCSEYLELSKISGKIYIDGNSGWAAFRSAGNCTGNGTYSEPYVIEDLVIDGGGVGSCILIENTDVYFRIENCTLYNAGGFNGVDNAGIRLSNVDNSQLINNNCSSNVIGLNLEYSDNNTILENIVNYNSWTGMFLVESDINIISGNTVNNNMFGILIDFCLLNNISTNVVKNNNRVGIYSSSCSLNTISGNTANNNSVGICLAFDIHDIISGNTVNKNNSSGISLHYSYSIIISGNTANNNNYGIYLTGSIDNNISGNTLIGNAECIVEEGNCEGNVFENNDCDGGIPIELIISISVISGGAAIGIATLLLIRRKRKRIE